MTDYVKQQVEMLRRDGYVDAANIIEWQNSQYNFAKEFECVTEFAATHDGADPFAREQLRALWTAYCFHTGADVDTGPYDSDLRRVWAQVKAAEQTAGWEAFDVFDDFMCSLLV